MMKAATPTLRDEAARRDAIGLHEQSILVEAGAGSGKTAVMAGRIAAMLAKGIAPKSIAAVTFTELAASELLVRIRDFLSDLAEGQIPTELQTAFPGGLSGSQRSNLAKALDALDEITCSTIHGFCQRLIKGYPVEADLDPGATVMDRSQADIAFAEIVDSWLREKLSADEGGIIAEMVIQNPGETVLLINKIIANLQKRRALSGPPVAPVSQQVADFRGAADAFAKFVGRSPVDETETKACAIRFTEMAGSLHDQLTAETPAGLIRLLTSAPHEDLCTKSGTFLAFKKKGKWIDAAKRNGLARADGERLHATAETHYSACCEAWHAMLQNVASRALADLIEQVQPVLQRFRDYKRSAALLDFDDLIFAARDLLRDHDDVRHALAARFAHVLVDEFQDTDPLQTEIFWRLCGEPTVSGAPSDWRTFWIRPGALFLVGDPKQAIYRFRGADVSAYVAARSAFMKQSSDSVLSISTNFRSCAPILTYVNQLFESLLSAEGQPGFTTLDAFHTDRGAAPCVAALDVAVADDTGKASAERQRDAEAEAVAEMCVRMIGSEPVADRRSGTKRTCRPGDIALLAPTGNDLWRYEEALERRGIPVATQAGKGLFRRQEIQDLIALTRALADRRDTLALGALLRGPLVGLTEEELLDIIWALPRRKDRPNALGRLDLAVDANDITHPLARATIETLQSLYRRSNSTTPHNLLSQAIDVMRVRPILLERHRGQAERALANVDLYLGFATAFAVRGLRAFAETMRAAWSNGAGAVEGRPDAQQEAVALFTMHAAKGLEWPIVVPINTMTGIMAPDGVFTDRKTDAFYCPVFGVKPTRYDEVRDAEKAELERERIRLWYVACTRARELLVLPRIDAAHSKLAWKSLLDLSLTELPALDVSHHPLEMGTIIAESRNEQTREKFAEEAATIAGLHGRLSWLAPSRDEGPTKAQFMPEEINIWSGPTDQYEEGAGAPQIQGGRERGLILHKLMEEVLTRETSDDAVALIERARTLIIALNKQAFDDPSQGLSAEELAGCVIRSLALPEVAELRPTLVPEFPVFASATLDDAECATAGIVDAFSLGTEAQAGTIIDWKSDVRPAAETIEHYRAQVRSYLNMTGTDRGLIVFMTSGRILTVAPSHPTSIAA